MGWLTGREVARQVAAGTIRIDPFDPAQCNPNSYDYRLAPILRRLTPNALRAGVPCLDPQKPVTYEEIVIPPSGYLLETAHAYLGVSLERFASTQYVALTTGKSSVGRLFVKNNLFQLGLVPQGASGPLSLRISAKLPTLVFAGMRIGQIFWFEPSDTALLIELAEAAA